MTSEYFCNHADLLLSGLPLQDLKSDESADAFADSSYVRLARSLLCHLVYRLNPVFIADSFKETSHSSQSSREDGHAQS
jgi:hypothetical protein